jgi:PAS domain-containing protein
MRAICSYCRLDLGEREPLDDPRVTHGMCPACADAFEKQWAGVELSEYLDTLPLPILVLDGERRTVGANEHLARLVGKNGSEILGRLPGEVAECIYSRLESGCGRTGHCTACTVRRAIAHTFETGESQVGVRALVQQEGRERALTISTHKRGNLVQLIVEDDG